jgi:hypothetical protein
MLHIRTPQNRHFRLTLTTNFPIIYDEGTLFYTYPLRKSGFFSMALKPISQNGKKGNIRLDSAFYQVIPDIYSFSLN